jgi:hypothetical protein
MIDIPFPKADEKVQIDEVQDRVEQLIRESAHSHEHMEVCFAKK